MFHLTGPHGDLKTPGVEQVEDEECDHFLSFAKRSRTVQRQYNVEPPPCPPSFLKPDTTVRYNQEFWDRILQWPSPVHTQVGVVGSGGQADGAAEHRLREGRAVELGKESLPAPSELFPGRRVRRVARRGDVTEMGVASVMRHISELRRRQGYIDQMKAERSWGFMADGGEEEMGVAGHDDLVQDQRPPDLGLVQGWGPCPDPTKRSLNNQQRMFAAGSDAVQSLAPGEDPMMSFVMATANRQSREGRCSPLLSHGKFWEYDFGSEE